jgi:hypothetical protein
VTVVVRVNRGVAFRRSWTSRRCSRRSSTLTGCTTGPCPTCPSAATHPHLTSQPAGESARAGQSVCVNICVSACVHVPRSVVWVEPLLPCGCLTADSTTEWCTLSMLAPWRRTSAATTSARWDSASSPTPLFPVCARAGSDPGLLQFRVVVVKCWCWAVVLAVLTVNVGVQRVARGLSLCTGASRRPRAASCASRWTLASC